MSNRLMFIDTETGGINPQKHSLLSVGIVIWDREEGELYSAEYFLKSDTYHVTKTAQQINHFAIESHGLNALDAAEVISHVCELKKVFFFDYPVIPLAGHNTQFDVQFIKKMFEDCNRSYEKVFSHRIVDTYSILKFLSDCGVVCGDVSSSAKAFRMFDIQVNGRHTALGDARATMQLYECLLRLNQKN